MFICLCVSLLLTTLYLLLQALHWMPTAYASCMNLSCFECVQSTYCAFTYAGCVYAHLTNNNNILASDTDACLEINLHLKTTTAAAVNNALFENEAVSSSTLIFFK